MDDRLHIFALVARSGSFAAAARAEGLDPSVVSRKVAALEEELGCRLFERTTRRLVLSGEGRIALPRATALVEDWLTLREMVRDDVDGWLRVTASVAFAERWLAPRLATFRDAHPGVSIDLLATDERVDLVDVDIALRLGVEPHGAGGGAFVSRLVATTYRVVAGPGWPAFAKPADLERANVLAMPLDGYRSRWLLRRRGGDATEAVDVTPVITASSAPVLLALVRQGAGVALLPDWLIERDLAAGHVVDVLPAHEASAAAFDTAAWIVTPSRRHRPRRVQALLDHLRGHA